MSFTRLGGWYESSKNAAYKTGDRAGGVAHARRWLGSAAAVPLASGPLVQVTGASPIAACDGDDGNIGGTNVTNSEVEPWLSVDPSNPMVMIGAWQQDRWSNGGSEGLVTATSTDGGAGWSVNANTKSTKCTGGTAAKRRELRAGLRPVDSCLPEWDRVPDEPVSGHQPGRV